MLSRSVPVVALGLAFVTACGGSTVQLADGGSSGPDGHAADAAAADGGGVPMNDILVPEHGALLGHFYGRGTVAATDARIGRKPAVHLRYFGWNEDWTTDVSSDFTEGRIPLVNWEPDTGNGQVDFDAIVSGDFDALIDARAHGSRDLGHKFFIDFAAEMNGDEGWGGHVPSRYIAAWRRIHDRFVAAGATNVVWIWAPNVTDVDGTTATTMAYYPGDAYVDWTGVDGYNWGTSDPDFEWQTFKDVFADIYPKLAAKGKPIFIGEMATDEVGGSKAEWIGAIVGTLKNDYPLVKGFVWFDIEKERKWQIDSSPAALAAYQRMASDPYMNP